MNRTLPGAFWWSVQVWMDSRAAHETEQLFFHEDFVLQVSLGPTVSFRPGLNPMGAKRDRARWN